MKILKKISYILLSLILSLSLFSCAKNTSAINNNNSQKISNTETSINNEDLYLDAHLDANESLNTNINTDLNNYTQLPEQGTYISKDDVALYINTYKKLPKNYITKSEARKLGWQVGNNNDLSKVAKGKSIGGDEFKNYEKLLPVIDGRIYYECDIDYVKGKRNAKRIVYAIDDDEDVNEEVHIYYTDDHYNSFTEIKFD